MDSGGSKQDKKEITYQVGWKKGKIVYADDGSHAHPHPLAAELQPRAADKWFARIWQPLPAPVPRSGFAVLWALPAVSFFLVVWLVYMLTLLRSY